MWCSHSAAGVWYLPTSFWANWVIASANPIASRAERARTWAVHSPLLKAA